MMKKQAGFTLIELMIVVAIIGILAAIALPAYQDYVIKSKVSEGLLATSQCRTTVAEVYQTHPAGTPAPAADGWGCGEGTPNPTQYVTAINTDTNGVITVTMNGATVGAAGTITLTPTDSAGAPLAMTPATTAVQVGGFDCSPGTLDPKYLPGSCK